LVEHLIPDPRNAPMNESEIRPGLPIRGGLCLVCGEWVEPGDDDNLYVVAVSAPRGDGAEYLSHATCLARVAHPGMRLPLRNTQMPAEAPPDYLDPKPKTSEGR
jgi:hypothetical protein